MNKCEDFLEKLHLFSVQLEGLVNVKAGSFWKSPTTGYESLIDTIKKFANTKYVPRMLDEPHIRDLSRTEQATLGKTIIEKCKIKALLY